jgi:inorganic pyrophosphatase
MHDDIGNIPDTGQKNGDPMDGLIILFASIVAIVVFDVFAVALGADSRDDFTEEHR